MATAETFTRQARLPGQGDPRPGDDGGRDSEQTTCGADVPTRATQHPRHHKADWREHQAGYAAAGVASDAILPSEPCRGSNHCGQGDNRRDVDVFPEAVTVGGG